MSTGKAAVDRAAKILELQKQVSAGRQAQLEYDEVYKKVNGLNSYVSMGRFYEERSEIYSTEREIEDLESQLAELTPVIKQGARAAKALKRMQQTDEQRHKKIMADSADKQRAQKIEQLTQARERIQFKLDSVYKQIESLDINLSVSDHPDDLHIE